MTVEKFITGLQVEMTPTELKQLLLEKSKFHEQRMKFMEAQLKKIKEGGLTVGDDADEELANVTKSSNYHAETIQKSLQDSIKGNRDKAKVYKFLAEHLVKKPYRLNHDDLAFLGLMYRY